MTLLGAAGTWWTWRFFVASVTGQRLDEVAYTGAHIGRRTLWRGAEPVLELISVPLLLLVLAIAAGVAVLRARWVVLLRVGVLLAGANLSTQVLKKLVLDRPDLLDGIAQRANSLPSGHTTVAASVAVAVLLLVPRSARPAVALLGGAYAAVTGIATLIGGWHRASDVIAALTVVLCWAGITTLITAVSRPERRDLPGLSTAAGAVSTVLVAGAVVCAALGVASLVRTHTRLQVVQELTDRADLATAYVGSALGVVAAAAVLAAATLIGHELAGSPAAEEPRRHP